MGRIYDRAEWRARPRDGCRIAELVGGECAGDICLHHVRPIVFGGDDEKVVPVCARHHPMLEALVRRIYAMPEYKRCPHQHRTAEAREACERRLNRAVAA